MDTPPADIADFDTSRQYEMQEVIGLSNEGTVESSAPQNIDQEDHTLLDDKPLLTTTKVMSSIDASVGKNRTRLRGMCFIAVICLAVLLSLLLTLVAITVAAASYANQSARQNDLAIKSVS